MEILNFNTIEEDPIAGCHHDFSNMKVYNSFLADICARMEIFTDSQTIANIVSCVIWDSEKAKINADQYIVNELLYEWRLLSKEVRTEPIDEYESNMIKLWAGFLLKNHDQDFVLDFITELKNCRSLRYRLGDKRYLGDERPGLKLS